MAEKKFDVADLRGVAGYLRARADSTKKRKREALLKQAGIVSLAADILEKCLTGDDDTSFLYCVECGREKEKSK